MVLEEIIEKTKKGERVYEDWLMLRNVYFRGTTGLQDMKDWAKKHDISAIPTDIVEQSFNSIKFNTVMFISNRKT